MVFCRVRLCLVTGTNEREETEQKEKIYICNASPEKAGIPLADNARFSNYSKTIKMPGLLSFHKDASLSVFISKTRMCNEQLTNSPRN